MPGLIKPVNVFYSTSSNPHVGVHGGLCPLLTFNSSPAPPWCQQEGLSVRCLPFRWELFGFLYTQFGFLGGSEVENPPANAGDASSITEAGRSLEREMSIHSSIVAYKIPWAEELGRLQSMGSQRVGHDWAAENACMHKNWPSPLPGASLAFWDGPHPECFFPE